MYVPLHHQNIVELKNNGMNNIESSKGEIVMYQPDETIRLEVRINARDSRSNDDIGF